MLNLSDLRQKADRQLDFAPYAPRQLVLIHTAVSLGASLIVALVNLLFASMIENTGGLSGLGTRSMLETAQSTLELAVTAALPFWNISLTRAALCWARGELAEPPTLLEGFRKFRSVLGLKLLTAFLLMGLGLAVFYIGSSVFMLTPFADPLVAALNPIMQQSGVLAPDALTEEAVAQVVNLAKPLFIFLGLVFAAVVIPLWYRVRFADFAVMDGCRGRVSLLESFRITKKKCLQVFKIDLSFWWFYLLQALCVILCYGDSILPAMGVALPMSAEVAYIAFMALGSICQGILLWFYQAKVSVTYALAYETLSAQSELKTKNGYFV